MPKNKKKLSKQKVAPAPANSGLAAIPAIEDEDVDSVSEFGSQISRTSYDDDPTAASPVDEGEMDRVTPVEDQLKESFENASNKNVSIRIEALKIIANLLTRHCCPDFLTNWKVTITDTMERSFRRGNDGESDMVLRIVMLLSIQLGAEYSPQLAALVNAIRIVLMDAKASLILRCSCATSLAVCMFNGEFEREVNLQALEALSSVWSQASSKWGSETAPLFVASINAWAFLLLKASAQYLHDTLKADIARICTFLENSQLEVRIVAGETLALLYEMARDVYGEDFRPSNYQTTLLQLRNMTTDSVKYRAKRDRRLQRASFREIMSAIKDDVSPEMHVKFGLETLVIDTWSVRLCYNMICHVLGSGMNIHLKENQQLRDLFDLGSVQLTSTPQKVSKFERNMLNQVLSKARTLHRGKQRDKRADVFS